MERKLHFGELVDSLRGDGERTRLGECSPCTSETVARIMNVAGISTLELKKSRV